MTTKHLCKWAEIMFFFINVLCVSWINIFLEYLVKKVIVDVLDMLLSLCEDKRICNVWTLDSVTGLLYCNLSQYVHLHRLECENLGNT
jgi:hypothetical protein